MKEKWVLRYVYTFCVEFPVLTNNYSKSVRTAVCLLYDLEGKMEINTQMQKN